MVRDISSDAMHLADQGVRRKLLMIYLEDNDYKISPLRVKRANEEMVNLATHTPTNFFRKSRTFCKKFKAIEWSQALRYTDFLNKFPPSNIIIF